MLATWSSTNVAKEKMAGVVVVGTDSSEVLEALYGDNKNKKDPTITSFEKEVNFIVQPVLKKARKSLLSTEASQKLSNGLFLVWSKYQRKIPEACFRDKLLSVADTLYQAGLFQLARNHGYRRYLMEAGLFTSPQPTLEEFVLQCEDEAVILAVLRSEIGDAICHYNITEEKDPLLMKESTRTVLLSSLSRLRTVSQLALCREDRYWLAHNTFLLSLTMACKMMRRGHASLVVEPLLWCGVCMESSVPLLASRYLRLRTNLYVAITQCYYQIDQPNEAELFARRALDKVNELAQIERESSNSVPSESALVYNESALKLGVLVFKKALFESYKKIKLPIKLKSHPGVQDLIQVPSPRSSTEKLLGEMFSSPSAQFLAVLETLTDPSRRALNRGPPHPLVDMDPDIVSDIYVELYTAGVDLIQKQLDNYTHTSSENTLLQSAIEGKDHIPLGAMTKFVRLAHIYEQKDVLEILAESVIEETQSSSDELVVCRGKGLQLMLAMELLEISHKRYKISLQKSAVPPAASKRAQSAAQKGGKTESESAAGPQGSRIGKGESGKSSASQEKKKGEGGVRISTPPTKGTAGRKDSEGKGEGGVRMSTPPTKGAGGKKESEVKGEGGVRISTPPTKGGGGGGKMDSEGKVDGSTSKGQRKSGEGVAGSPPQDARPASSSKKTSSRMGSGKEETEKDEEERVSPADELYDALVKVTHFLHFTLQNTPALISVDYDLLLDSLLKCWEVVKPVLSSITTHDYSSCKTFLCHNTGMQYMELLSELVAVAHSLELWRVDCLLHGELTLKLSCLLEAKAENQQAPPFLDGRQVTFMNYDRAQLLTCREELERVVVFVKQCREWEEREKGEGRERGERAGKLDSATDLSMLQVECEYSLARVQVKLASTNLPPDFFATEGRFSTLKSKVMEQQAKLRERRALVSKLPAMDVRVPSVEELMEGCGKNQFLRGLLLMQQATHTPGLSLPQKHKLMEDSYNCLLQEQQWLEDYSKSTMPGPATFFFSSTSSSVLPPPTLLAAMETRVELAPPTSPPSLLEEVAFFKVYGKAASGSNVKVRETDRLLPGLGVEVPAEPNCRLVVEGLQPNQDYVFAVSAFTIDGKRVGKSIGRTSRPYRTSFFLPLLNAWGYCCQSSFVVGANSVADKTSKILWNHFVSDDNKKQEENLHLYKLKQSTISPSYSTQLHLFLSSILISAHMSLSQDSLRMDQLSPPGPLLPNQRQRLELARRLLVGVEVAGLLNDAQLCLQVVVKCYGLVAPLIQLRVPSRLLVEVLLYCFSVLMELPEHLLNSKFPAVTASLHHMIAAISYYVGTMLLMWHKRAMFSRFSEGVKSLLLLTLSGAVQGQKVMQDTTVLSNLGEEEGGASSMVLSMANFLREPALHNPNLNSSSPSKQTMGRKKKSRKRVHIMMDHIPDENKTAELKSIEAFFISHQQSLDDLELGGGEDPIVLHYIINNLPSIVAHREVHKFKRRPQYLEMLVHLLNSTLAKGHHDRILEWLAEGFVWITKRNEILLNPRAVHRVIGEQAIVGRVPGKGNTSKGQRLISSSKTEVKKVASRGVSPIGQGRVLSGLAKAMRQVQRDTSGLKSKAVSKFNLPQSGGGSDGGGPNRKRSTAAAIMMGTGVGKESTIALQQYTRRSLMPNLAAELSKHVRITKEDLEIRSTAVLICKLPEMWRIHKCRKRLRGVCNEEQPWRCQANLVQASCYLHQVLVRLRSEVEAGERGTGSGSGGGAKRGGGTEDRGGRRPFTSDGLRFDAAGVIIEGVIPSFPSAIAGQGLNKLLSVPGMEALRAHSPGSTLHPALSSSVQTLILNDICQVMKCHQRAAVLAERGHLWILLQNVARSLWNAINSLAVTISRFNRETRVVTMGAIYGLALKPLHFVVEGLVELLGECRVWKPLAQVTGLGGTCGLDEEHGIGLAAIKQIVFLALHTFYVHQHWEKVLALGTQFDDVTRHSWSDQLVPLLESAQAKLATRVSAHNNTNPIHHDKLDPAAHLDPGPKGYNVYGAVGFSLHLVPNVLLDKDTVAKRLKLQEEVVDSDTLRTQQAVMACRRLFQRYAAGLKQIGGPTGITVTVDDVMPELEPGTVDVRGLVKAQVSLLVGAYENTLRLIFQSSDISKDLAVQLRNELGDIMMLSGNVRLAKQHWMEALSMVLGGIKNPLINWRKANVKGCGLWACFMGAMISSKLLRHVFWKHLDVRLDCVLLATSLLKTALSYSLPYPSSDMAYASFDHTPSLGGVPVTLFSGLDLFSDPFRCSPTHLLSALRCCSEELVNRGYAKKALPILWLYDHIAVVNCRAVQEAVYARILRLRVLTQLSLFSAAILQLQELLTGHGLPQGSTHWIRPPESTGSALPKFQDQCPVSDSNNAKIVLNVLEKHLKPQFVSLYGPFNVSRLILARALLYVALARGVSLSGPIFNLGSKNVPKPQGPSRTQGTRTPTQPESPITSSKPSITTRDSVFTHVFSNTKKASRSNIKLILVYTTEEMLESLCEHQVEGEGRVQSAELKVLSLLALAELAVTLQQCISGYQLSLQAVRLLQAMEVGGGGKGGKIEGVSGTLPSLDIRLWLEARYWMARSVVGLEEAPGGGSLLLEVGELCEECSKLGEVELMAEMEYAAAEHALSLLPCQLQAAQQHSQRCVELLNSVPEPSYKGQVLCCRATLLLADTACVRGTTPTTTTTTTHPGAGDVEQTSTMSAQQMVEVLQGLVKTLKKQIEEERLSSSSINAHQPRHSLLASCFLRLGYAHILLSNTKVESDEFGEKCSLIREGHDCFKEGLDVMEEMSLSDPCLAAELLFGRGWTMATLPQYFKLDESIAVLSKSGKLLVDNGTDYRLASTVFLTLAELNAKKKKVLYAKYARRKSDARPSISFAAGDRRVSLYEKDFGIAPSHVTPSHPSYTSSHTPSHPIKNAWEGKWDRGGWELGGRENYLSWCQIRATLRITTARQSLQSLAASASTSDMTKPLSEKVLHELPDFVLLELCPESVTLKALSGRTGLLPIKSLLPSQQHRPTADINWFKIVNYYNHLLRRCYWQKIALYLPESDWELHYHQATPTLFVKAKAVLAFLTANCPNFKSCLLPPIPQLGMLPPGGIAPWTSVGTSHAHREPHLIASEAEATILWYYNPLPPILHAVDPTYQLLPPSGRITGYFALNSKSISFPVHAEPYQLGMETTVVHTSLSQLRELHEKWKELSKAVKVYLEARNSLRPVSRSPLKQRKAEKNMVPPDELIQSISDAVKEIACFLESKAKEYPRLELHAVPLMTKLTEPFLQATLKGDTFYFLRELFHIPKQVAPLAP